MDRQRDRYIVDIVIDLKRWLVNIVLTTEFSNFFTLSCTNISRTYPGICPGGAYIFFFPGGLAPIAPWKIYKVTNKWFHSPKRETSICVTFFSEILKFDNFFRNRKFLSFPYNFILLFNLQMDKDNSAFQKYMELSCVNF